MGRTKAAVLPVPVWAAARTSRPSRTRGMALAWTGVGVVVSLFRDGAEQVGRQAEGIEGQAGLLGAILARARISGARVVMRSLITDRAVRVARA